MSAWAKRTSVRTMYSRANSAPLLPVVEPPRSKPSSWRRFQIRLPPLQGPTSDEARKRNRRWFRRLALFGIIVIVLAVSTAGVWACLHPMSEAEQRQLLSYLIAGDALFVAATVLLYNIDFRRWRRDVDAERADLERRRDWLLRKLT